MSFKDMGPMFKPLKEDLESDDNGNPLKGDDRFREKLELMWMMHCKKGNDYGSEDDFLANLRASEGFGIEAWIGALVRANDKMIRLKNAAKGEYLVNESVQDSLMDLACYALLSLILFEEIVPPTVTEVDWLQTWKDENEK